MRCRLVWGSLPAGAARQTWRRSIVTRSPYGFTQREDLDSITLVGTTATGSVLFMDSTPLTGVNMDAVHVLSDTEVVVSFAGVTPFRQDEDLFLFTRTGTTAIASALFMNTTPLSGGFGNGTIPRGGGLRAAVFLVRSEDRIGWISDICVSCWRVRSWLSAVGQCIANYFGLASSTGRSRD